MQYEYVNIDDNWQAPHRAPNGSLLPNPATFPHGMAFLAAEAHSRRLKLGIYSARGNRTCQGRPGSAGHYEIDAHTFALWGVDYLKRAPPPTPVDPLVSVWGVERRAEISGLGARASCFLALGSGLGLVGTVSARR